jgi:hypothetical protein
MPTLINYVAAEIATTLFLRVYKSYCKWCWNTFGDIDIDFE